VNQQNVTANAASVANVPLPKHNSRPPSNKKRPPSIPNPKRSIVYLHPEFRPGWRFAIKRSLHSIALATIGIAFYSIIHGWDSLLTPPTMSFSTAQYPEFLILRCHLMYTVGELAYWELYRHSMQLWTDGRRFFVKRGVFCSSESSSPLSGPTEVFIFQKSVDVFFGLWSLHVASPMQSHGSSGHHKSGLIEGLSRKRALKLRMLLVDILNGDSMTIHKTFTSTKKTRKLLPIG
jgi:hypothetical protein